MPETKLIIKVSLEGTDSVCDRKKTIVTSYIFCVITV